MNSIKKNYVFVLLALFGCSIGASPAFAQPVTTDRDRPDSASLSWDFGRIAADAGNGEYTIEIRHKGVTILDGFVNGVTPEGLVTGTQNVRSPGKLQADLTYLAIVREAPSSGATAPLRERRGNINPYDPNRAKGGSGFGFGLGGGRDILAQRMDSYAKNVKSQADHLRARGEYLKDQAETRKIVAKAVDLELDNWKKHVITYFERREINSIGRMRQKDLYEISKDQQLRIRDNGARRRYDNMKKHLKISGGSSVYNLNYMLDRFVGTPIGYGSSLELLFDGNPRHSQWTLTPTMHKQLRVKTKSNGGGSRVFSLDQPTPIAMDYWPGFFMHAKFKKFRRSAKSLNEKLLVTSDPSDVREIATQLENRFVSLSREFFRDQKKIGNAMNASQRELMITEDFLAQKLYEIRFFKENPTQIAYYSREFEPTIDGRDVGTLISWMNGNGLQFASPLPGNDGAYSNVLRMMMDVYGLMGEPVMNASADVEYELFDYELKGYNNKKSEKRED